MAWKHRLAGPGVFEGFLFLFFDDFSWRAGTKMALVWSEQQKAYKTKWSHSCQPRWPPASHDTLVQEGNYLSQSKHIWQADTPMISAHLTRTAVSAERDHPQIRSWGNAHLPSGVTRHRSRYPEGGVHLCQGVTEAGSRPLPRERSPHQGCSNPR